MVSSLPRLVDEAYREAILLLESRDLRTRDRFPLPPDFTAHSAGQFAHWASAQDSFLSIGYFPPNQCGLGVGAYGPLTGDAWAWVLCLASCHWGDVILSLYWLLHLMALRGGLRVASELSAQGKNRWEGGEGRSRKPNRWGSCHLVPVNGILPLGTLETSQLSLHVSVTSYFWFLPSKANPTLTAPLNWKW